MTAAVSNLQLSPIVVTAKNKIKVVDARCVFENTLLLHHLDMKDLYFVLVLFLLVNICTRIHKKCMIFFIFLHLYAYYILTL